MKAVICESYGGPDSVQVRTVPDPHPPAAGELQLRFRARGVQFVDLLQIAGTYQVRHEVPFIPGAEAAGEVIGVGPGVNRVHHGQNVMTRLRKGAWVEMANVSEAACHPIPSALNLEEAAVLQSGHGTAYHALLNRGRLRSAEWVLVHGAAGGIGIPAIQVARWAGAHVIATASTEAKRAACLQEGASHAIAYSGGFLEQVKAITDGRGVDVVYDPIGGAVTEESLRCLAYGGRLLILGFLGGGPASIRSNYLLIKAIESVGVYMGRFQAEQPELFEANAREIVSLAASGVFRPRISHRFPLEQASEALRAIAARAVIGRAVLTG